MLKRGEKKLASLFNNGLTGKHVFLFMFLVGYPIITYFLPREILNNIHGFNIVLFMFGIPLASAYLWTYRRDFVWLSKIPVSISKRGFVGACRHMSGYLDGFMVFRFAFYIYFSYRYFWLHIDLWTAVQNAFFGGAFWGLIWPVLEKLVGAVFGFVAKPLNIVDKTISNIKAKPKGFALWMGQSTGIMTERSHSTGISPNQEIYLALPDACQNVVTIGGIGSGKTTRIMQPILKQVLTQDCGGLIFDIKSDFKNAVYKLAAEQGRQVETIGIGHRGVNLLKGLSPEMSAAFLKSAFYLSGGGNVEAFWVDSATELCKNALGVLSYVPGGYSLEGLYRYLFYDNAREEYNAQAHDAMIGLDERNTRLLIAYMDYYDRVFLAFDEKVKRGILASVSQVLSPFQHPDLVDAFCTDSGNNADIEDVLNGTIFLVDLPLAVHGLGAKAVYTFIKLRFFNVLQSRPSRPDMNQDRPVFFMCDEYQDIISANKAGLSDLNFWDKSRSAKCIGIISTQSVNSFRAAIGDKTLADTILQNFRQKVFFRTEDIETINYMNQIGGKVEVQRYSQNTNSGKSSTGGFLGSSNSSEGSSLSWQERPAVDAQLIRSLGQNQAIAFYNIDGHAMDDVVNLKPVFVESK